jgi:hypothetical protein
MVKVPKPKCVACNGTGQKSNGRGPCVPCLGTGLGNLFRCNRCNRISRKTGYCVKCKCPEMRIVE